MSKKSESLLEVLFGEERATKKVKKKKRCKDPHSCPCSACKKRRPKKR